MLTQPPMRDAVDRLVPSIRDVVSYHLGWTDAAGNPTAVKGGKGIRDRTGHPVRGGQLG